MLLEYTKQELKAEIKRRQGLPAVAQWWAWRKTQPFGPVIWLGEIEKEWEGSKFFTTTHTVSLRMLLKTQGATLTSKNIKGLNQEGQRVSRFCTEVVL